MFPGRKRIYGGRQREIISGKICVDTALSRRRIPYACRSDNPAGTDMLHRNSGDPVPERAGIPVCHLSWRVCPENRKWRTVHPPGKIPPESPFPQTDRKRAARAAKRENDAEDQGKRILPGRVYASVRGQDHISHRDG